MLNKIMIIGNLGSEPEMRFMPSGKPTTSFSVAVNRKFTVDGEKRESTEWFSVDSWGKIAESCNQFLDKGSKVYVEGRQQTDKWTDDKGEKHQKIKLIAQRVIFLSENKKSSESHTSEPIPFDDEENPY